MAHIWMCRRNFIAFAALFLFACGDDNNSSGNFDEVVAISDKIVSGVSQKGPFVNGSSVSVQELDGETLAQTGLVFEGKIKNDMGEFLVKVKKLESQYALLKANGFYRNEVTGKKSNSPVTLYALTDLSNRDEVNVNLLTHLAYERSLYLATEESMPVAKAKKQAEKEILNSFGIEGDFDAAEDLNIFGEDDQSAALLAVSVLMQGKLSEADFSERLANYAADIETDGVWNDFVIVTQIADWASAQGLGSGLDKIRKNITGWNLSTGVPAFEKYVNNFWWQNYGIGKCDKEREGEVKKNQNSSSSLAEEYFICKSDAWIVATDIERDTATWGAGAFDNEIRVGQVNKNAYYIYEINKKSWRKATTFEKDTYDYKKNKSWSAGENGEIKKGSVTDSIYVYDATAWRMADDVEMVLGGCVSTIADSIGKTGGGYYICTSRKWTPATPLQYDTYKKECSEFGQIVYGNVNRDKAYFCYGNEWNYFYGNESIPYGKLIDERDGQVYRTVKIGSQTWMAENLKYADSVSHPSIQGHTSCLEDNCQKYGRLYNLWAVLDSNDYKTEGPMGTESIIKDLGVCPSGWRIPSFDDWHTLENVMGRKPEVWLAKENKYRSNSTDDYGFSVLADIEYYYNNSRYYASFISASVFVGDDFVSLAIVWEERDYWFGMYSGIRMGFVRCIKDEE